MSRRDLIRMTDDEIRKFIRESRTMTICSIGSDGFPHPMPMWFAFDDDGTVRMTTFKKSQKVRNVERDPRVTLMVEDGEEYAQLRGVVMYGRCELIDDTEQVIDTLAAIGGAEMPSDPEAAKALRAGIGRTASKRMLLQIKPDRIVSWDHRKLEGKY